jgi:hypothetical protein
VINDHLHGPAEPAAAAGHEMAVITGYSRESMRRIQRDAGIEPND